MIRFKIDIMAALKKNGWNTTRIQREHILATRSYTSIKNGDATINMETLNKLCLMLRCQPGDIIEIIPTDEEKIKYY